MKVNCGFSYLALASLSFASQSPSQQPIFGGDVGTNKLDLASDLLEFHKNLVEIESISGNEKDVGNWLAQSLESQGYTVEKQIVSEDPYRFNIYAHPGSNRDAPVVLSSHIDTVPPFYSYKRTGSRGNTTISGRGSVDAKGSVAAQVMAVNRLISSGKISPDDVAVLFVVGEEVGGEGMQKANDLDLKAKTVIFGEPTEGKLVAGHKGIRSFTIKAKGRAAHSGYPWLGRSANEVIVRALLPLITLGDHLPQNDKYGKTTLNLGKIEGGVAGNVVAESASAQVAVRIAEGTPALIEEAVINAVHQAVAEFVDDGMKVDDVVEIEFRGRGYGPIDIDADVPGFEVITVNYGTDIPWLNRTVENQKRYLYGPGTIFVAHSDHEALNEKDLFTAVDGYEKIVLHALGKDD